MKANGKASWAYAVQGEPTPMLRAALTSLQRNGKEPRKLPACEGESCNWFRRLAECLQQGQCDGVVLFCKDASVACCVSNKHAGVRAASVETVPQARRALNAVGANFLIVETAGKTYYECRELLRLCQDQSSLCPPGVACVLQELESHARR